MKELSKPQLKELDRLTGNALKDIQAAWVISAKGMKFKSNEYQRLCRVGNQLQKFHLGIKAQAEERGVEVESVDFVCKFG